MDENAVGLKFNPGNNADVDFVKRHFEAIIDFLENARLNSEDMEMRRLFAIAITEAQDAQMWAVKAITWKSEW